MSEQMGFTREQLKLIIEKKVINCEECGSEHFSLTNGTLPIDDREYKVLVATCKNCGFFHVHNLGKLDK